MTTAIDRTSDLYDAMPVFIPSIRADDSTPSGEAGENSSLEPNGVDVRSGGLPLRDEVTRLIETAADFYRNGKLDESAACYRKALELRADSKISLYSLGVISGHLQRYEESKAAFDRLLRLLEDLGSNVEPSALARAHQGIGAALLGLWDATGPHEPPLELASKAELEFRHAVDLDPGYLGAWLGLGWALHILERLDDAETAFRKALELEPDSQVATERLRGVLEDKLERRLFELGYLSRINKTIRDFTPYENRTLVRVEGKPLSQIILEERR